MKNIKCLVGLVAFSVAAGVSAVTPESQGVDSEGILKFIDACEKTFDGGDRGSVHGFVIRRHGQVVAEGTWAPQQTLTRQHMLYSHSKSFTSTAIGFLVDDGRLDLDERVVDIFPDKLPAPEALAPKMRELRVRDLLTMNVGASNSDPMRNDPKGDWLKAVLGNRVEQNPGTVFKYDSSATFTLAAIVERRTGKRLMDFLDERLFQPLGIVGAWTGTAPDGTACGGWGMNMTTRDLAKFGQLYLDKGVWEGRRILSSEWVELATARHTWSGKIAVTGEDGSDWHQGYGFQFWRCRHGAYRADGAAGQYTVVFPAKDAVVSMNAGLGDMQRELNLIWQYLLPAFSDQPLPENPDAAKRLAERCASLKMAVPTGVAAPDPLPSAAGEIQGKDDLFRFSRPEIRKEGSGWKLVEQGRELNVGAGDWAVTKWKFTDGVVEPIFNVTSEREIAAAGAWLADGTLEVRWTMLGGIRHGTLRFKFPAK